MPVFGSAQKFGTVKRLEEVASAKRPRDIDWRDVHRARLFPVHVHLDHRIVERLDDLQVPQPGNLRQLGLDFRRIRAGLAEIRAAHGHFHRRGGAETHHLVDDVGRLEGELHVRQRLGQLPAEFFLELLDVDSAFPLQSHPHHGVLRSAHPLIHGIDRIGGGNRAEVSQGHLHVAGSRGRFDDLQGFQDDLLGAVDVRSVRGPHAQPELSGVDGRENLRAQP